jgi:hypothetical protein
MYTYTHRSWDVRQPCSQKGRGRTYGQKSTQTWNCTHSRAQETNTAPKPGGWHQATSKPQEHGSHHICSIADHEPNHKEVPDTTALMKTMRDTHSPPQPGGGIPLCLHNKPHLHFQKYPPRIFRREIHNRPETHRQRPNLVSEKQPPPTSLHLAPLPRVRTLLHTDILREQPAYHGNPTDMTPWLRILAQTISREISTKT